VSLQGVMAATETLDVPNVEPELLASAVRDDVVDDLRANLTAVAGALDAPRIRGNERVAQLAPRVVVSTLGSGAPAVLRLAARAEAGRLTYEGAAAVLARAGRKVSHRQSFRGTW
jgi:hypothetical protein